MTLRQCQSGVILSVADCSVCKFALRKTGNHFGFNNETKKKIMDTLFEKLCRVVSAPASILLASVVIPGPLLAQDGLTTRPTFQETHALIEELILDKPILQNYWHKLDFPQYNHFDDAVWSVVMYSGDECQVTYRRKIEISHKAPATVKPIHGDKPKTIIGFKLAKFDMAQVESVEIYDYEDGRGSIPSVGIRFVVPTAEWPTIGDKPRKSDLDKDPVMKKENAISVIAKDSERVLNAFRQLQALCQAKDDSPT